MQATIDRVMSTYECRCISPPTKSGKPESASQSFVESKSSDEPILAVEVLKHLRGRPSKQSPPRGGWLTSERRRIAHRAYTAS